MAIVTKPPDTAPAALQRVGRRERLHSPSRTERQAGLLFVAPTLLVLVAFVVVPILGAVGLSLTEWSLVGSPTFVGLENYGSLANDPRFASILVTTLKIAVGIAIPSALIALVLAVSLASTRGAGAYLSVFFVPAVLPSVVSAIIWAALYQADGTVNRLLRTDIAWLTDDSWALPALVIMMIWTNLGYYTIVMTAGVRSVPRECIEAARVDGAGPFRIFRYITLPLLRPVLLFVGVIATTEALNLFVQPFLLTRGGPGDTTRPLAELIYETAFQFSQVGYASAMAVVLVILAGVVAAAQFALLRRNRD